MNDQEVPEVGSKLPFSYDPLESIIHTIAHRHVPVWIVTDQHWDRWARKTELVIECSKCRAKAAPWLQGTGV